jgi:hypothetical protein
VHVSGEYAHGGQQTTRVGIDGTAASSGNPTLRLAALGMQSCEVED